MTAFEFRRTFHSASLSLILISLSSIACSSGNKRILRDMALGGIMGAAVGQTKTENRGAYTAMYAGIGASLAGAGSAIFSSDPADLEKQNKSLQLQLDEFQQRLQPKLIGQGQSLYNSPLPKEVSSLVEPGEWKRYKMDEWVQDASNPNVYYRQVEMFEVIPPTAR